MTQRQRRRCKGIAMGAIVLDLRPGKGIGPFSLGFGGSRYVDFDVKEEEEMGVCGERGGVSGEDGSVSKGRGVGAARVRTGYLPLKSVSENNYYILHITQCNNPTNWLSQSRVRRQKRSIQKSSIHFKCNGEIAG
ncbi:hypothetical protein Leryth_027007 [Lithospermum erythrorhizon]|nr:hypothetical protein Leryth_027007 [Lithospermum erythrorhizon]